MTGNHQFRTTYYPDRPTVIYCTKCGICSPAQLLTELEMKDCVI